MRVVKYFLGKFRPYNRIKTPIILQLSETECGVATLAMLLAYFNVHVPLEELRDQCGASRDGCKASTLIQVAERYGFEGAAYRVDWDEISNLEVPVIAYWNFKHYVIIKGVGAGKVFINDPACGAMTVSLDEFDKLFTGVIISILPTEKVFHLKSKPAIASLFYEWLSKFKKELIFTLLCLIMVIGSPLFNSALSTVFIDYCIISYHPDWVPYIVMLTVFSATIYIGSSIVQRWTQFKLCTKASILKSSTIISHTLQLPLLFYSLRQKSEIITILTRAEYIFNLILKNMSNFAIYFLAGIFCLIAMIKIDANLALLSILMVIISCLIFYVLSKFNLSYERSTIASQGKLYAYSLASMRNIETIKSCALEMNVLMKWHALFTQKIMIQDKSNVITMMTNVLSKATSSISMLAILCLGGLRIAEGAMSVGRLMAYYGLHLFFCNSLNILFQAFKDGQSAYASHARVHGLMEYNQDTRFNARKNSVSQLDASLTVLACKNVYFHYNKTLPPTLNNISINIQQGQHIALVGATGSGKSTLAKLLCALYSPSSGEVIYQHNNLLEFSATELATMIAYMSQDDSLFSGTIYQNLTLWREHIELSDVNKVIRVACLEEFIQAKGLHGLVDEQGSNLSGGEKQRLGVARTLLQNTPILILDEATSALDTQTEIRLINNLRKLNKTVIFVAHRLSSIQHCDHILVMEKGVIVESGTHQQLIQNEKYYYQLVNNGHAECLK